ncbi:MAG TPA: rRNA maturation RNase YbeY [Gammaproteobacteria bacterium]|nr:rRNA maturation RNase YbeY [Gammaproteobacteria bacterium]HBQ01537.1 rRNA maturation RNase YbeY [Gammaproteobacteria bacterium]HCA36330.1 rRNA maturation RNase YbeY [Gammaproteobacteria bacterium]|tara:strand:- start:399 stop:872 length:474 start_codon:yes stop_codon:yes gene_type:complete
MTLTVEIDNDCPEQWTPNQQFCENCLGIAQTIAKKPEPLTVSLRFVSRSESKDLNSTYRNKQTPTNVLSFPADLPAELLESLDSEPIGDIVVCPEVVTAEADQQHKPLQDHWSQMLIHGFFHLLGYDHESEADAEKMEALEIKCLKKLGISNPYLIG